MSISYSAILLLPQLPLTSFQSYSIKLPFWEFRTIAPGIRTKHIRCYTALTHNNHHNHHIASNPISVAQVFITFLCLGFHRETVLSQIRFLFSYKINLIHIVFAFAFFLFLFECFLIFLLDKSYSYCLCLHFCLTQSSQKRFVCHIKDTNNYGITTYLFWK